MSYLEMLELAAKAAGVTLDFSIRGDFPPYYVNERGGHSSWNPITDDGDALRLAVKLAIDFKIRNGVTWWDHLESDGVVYWGHEPHRDEPLAATRRAIVRAAAEIGRSMK